MPTLIAILSDIHGNLPALEAVLEDLSSQEITQIISLGDVSGYYPLINEVIDLLRSHDAINLIGNHDRYIIDDTECPRSSSANRCLQYQRSVITESNRRWLAQSLPSLKLGQASMVHGGWEDPEDEYLYTIRPSYFERFDAEYFFCGHTHVQAHIRLNARQYFTNPGSVGQPRDGIASAAYALFDEKNGKVTLKRRSYEIDKIATQMKRLGFEEKFYANLYTGSRIGGRVDSIRLEQ
jgi:predicted phosphodiesterase